MHAGRIVFSQLLDFLPKKQFDRCIRQYHGNHRIKTFSCFDQYLCMAFAQITYCGKCLKQVPVERVSSRLDVSFGFEQHFIRGQKKMKLRVGLALLVMLAMALGRVKEKQKNNLRSLVQTA